MKYDFNNQSLNHSSNHSSKKVLITGGLGYIGSHAAVSLVEAGCDVSVIDNLSNSDESVVLKIEKITGEKVKFYKGDVCEPPDIETVISDFNPDYIVHLASRKGVLDSIQRPLAHYETNLKGSLTVLHSANKHNVKGIIFSSSAAVYSNKYDVPYSENSETGECNNPYGWSKLMCEKIMSDVCAANGISLVILRYFNVCGAHDSALIGEKGGGSLMSNLNIAACPNKLANLRTAFPNQSANLRDASTNKSAADFDNNFQIYGDDYPTKDGTCVRDYIHVLDVADAHINSIEYIEKNHVVSDAFNIGTGKPYSVREVCEAYEKANNLSINAHISDRREGDVPIAYAGVDRAKKVLGFEAKRTINDMCKSAYEFYKSHAK